MTAFFGVSGWGRILVPINFRLNAEEIGYIVEHSGAEVLLVDPELDDALAGVTEAAAGARRASDQDLYRFDCRARAVGGRRGRDRDDQLHERHDGAPEGRRAHAPHDLVERDHLRLAGRRLRPRRVPPHAADVPLQRLGHAVRGHGHGRSGTSCCARSTAPRSCAGSTGTASRCSTARRRSSPRSSTPPRPGTARFRARPHAHHRRGRAAADAHDRTGRDRARLGVHPDLRPHRDRAAAHDEPRPPEYDDLSPASARRVSVAPARRRSARAESSTPRARCSREQRRDGGATGSSRPRPRRRCATAGSTPATAASSTTRTTSRSPTARRT